MGGNLPDKDRVGGIPGNLQQSTSHLSKVVEEVLDNDVLLPASWQVFRLNQDLIGNGEGRDVAEALDDVDGAVVDDQNLIEKILRNSNLAESNNTRVHATNIGVTNYLPERREEG